MAAVPPSSAKGWPCSTRGSGVRGPWARVGLSWCPAWSLPAGAYQAPAPGSHRLCGASAGCPMALQVSGQGPVSPGASLALQSGLFPGF